MYTALVRACPNMTWITWEEHHLGQASGEQCLVERSKLFLEGWLLSPIPPSVALPRELSKETHHPGQPL